MQIDELMERIRRLPPAKRQQLDEIVRSLEETPHATLESGGALQPIRGLLRDLGPAPSADVIDDARRELWVRGRRDPAARCA
jgi:hypothetical protein